MALKDVFINEDRAKNVIWRGSYDDLVALGETDPEVKHIARDFYGHCTAYSSSPMYRRYPSSYAFWIEDDGTGRKFFARQTGPSVNKWIPVEDLIEVDPDDRMQWSVNLPSYRTHGGDKPGWNEIAKTFIDNGGDPEDDDAFFEFFDTQVDPKSAKEWQQTMGDTGSMNASSIFDPEKKDASLAKMANQADPQPTLPKLSSVFSSKNDKQYKN